jgi:Flp pilus assembly protein TadD
MVLKRLFLNACLVAGLLCLIHPASAQQDIFNVIFHGKVVLENGSIPPQSVGIERFCSDNSGTAPGPPTNKNGEYSWAVVIDTTNTRNCRLHAILKGYKSTSVDVNFNNYFTNSKSTGMQELPNIVLVPDFQDPSTLIITNVGVPQKSLPAWKAGMKALEASDFTEAARQIEEAMKTAPKFSLGWQTLGVVYAREAKLEDARGAFQHAIEVDPKLLPPYVTLARVCVRINDWPCVAKASGDLLTMDLKKVYASETYLHQAVARFGLKDLPGAESSIQEALRLDPLHKNPRAEYVLGRILEAKGDLNGATEHMLKYLELAPTARDGDQIRAHMQIMGGPEAATAQQPALELP